LKLPTTIKECDMINNALSPIHPGEFLKEALEELNLSQAQFARAIGVSPMRISHVVNATRPVTAELALLFGRAFKQSPQYWLNLQADYDLKTAQRAIRAQLRGVRPLAHA
jgi:addiction module HigA family antidote